MTEHASDRDALILALDLAAYPRVVPFSIMFRFVPAWKDSPAILSAAVLPHHVRFI